MGRGARARSSGERSRTRGRRAARGGAEARGYALQEEARGFAADVRREAAPGLVAEDAREE
eukprot:6795085-Alexandrium_andersonii.AAC.1